MLGIRSGFKPGRTRAVLLVAVICFAAGLMIGGVSARAMSAMQKAESAGHLAAYLQLLPTDSASNMAVFRESFFKHVKLIVVIWFLAFAPIGGLGIYLLLIFRGAAYGYTTALLVQHYGGDGAALAVMLYLPQLLTMLPAYLFAACAAVHYILSNIDHVRPGVSLGKYGASLCVGFFAAVVAALLDTYMTPMLVAHLA